MKHLLRWAICVIGVVIVSSAGADSVAPEIRDDGKLFSPAAVKKADERIREIYRKHDRDVLIETVATVPAADVEKVKAMDAKQTADYFLRWAKDRVQQRVVNGVYMLYCKEPRYLRTGVVERDPHKFAAGTSAALYDFVAKDFNAGRFDESFDLALKFVEDKLAKAK